MAGQSGSKAGGAVLEREEKAPVGGLSLGASDSSAELLKEIKESRARQDRLEAELAEMKAAGVAAGASTAPKPKGFSFTPAERQAFLSRPISRAKIFNILGRIEPMQVFEDQVIQGANQNQPGRTPGLFVMWKDHIGPGVDIPMPKWVRDMVVDPMEAELKNSRWSRAERWEIGYWDAAACEEVAITKDDVLTFNLLELLDNEKRDSAAIERMVRPGHYPLAEVMKRIEALPKWGITVVPGNVLQDYLRAEYGRLDGEEQAARQREAMAARLRPGALKAGGI